MEITRKSFLSGAAAGLAGLTLLPAAAWAAPATEAEGGILWLRNAAGQTFTARSADGDGSSGHLSSFGRGMSCGL